MIEDTTAELIVITSTVGSRNTWEEDRIVWKYDINNGGQASTEGLYGGDFFEGGRQT